MKVLNSYKSPMKRIHKVKTAVIVKDTIPDDITLENGLEITCYPKGWTPPEIPKVVEEVSERQYSLFDTEEGADT